MSACEDVQPLYPEPMPSPPHAKDFLAQEQPSRFRQAGSLPLVVGRGDTRTQAAPATGSLPVVEFTG